MRIDILTLFPEMFESTLGSSIIGKAVENGVLDIRYTQIREFAANKHRQVDDYPYGGGRGMVMQCQPIYDAYCSVCEDGKKPKTIYLSPQGKVFRQSTAKRLSKEERLIFLCGHYEGVDQRVLDEIVDEEISIGDFVLTGGEIAAMAVIDATARLIPGVLPDKEVYAEESHFNGLLEYPQYTRPAQWRGKTVPEELLSGHHKNIAVWKRRMSIRNTFLKRRGMLRTAKLTEEERAFAEALKKK